MCIRHLFFCSLSPTKLKFSFVYSFFNFAAKKYLKNQGCILEQFFVCQSCSQLNRLSNSVHNTPVYCSFQAVKVYQSRNFHFFYPFFDFGGHFGMKKVLLNYGFLIFFKIFVKFSLVLLYPYLSFHLKSGKIIFRCRFYQNFLCFLIFLTKIVQRHT